MSSEQIDFNKFKNPSELNALMDSLTYNSYSYNRTKGMSHDSLKSILPISDERAEEYKQAYELEISK